MDSQSTSTFYTFIASLRRNILNDVKKTTGAHRFLRTLRDSKRLVRCYTQNIDGLETREGLCADLGRGKGNRARFTKKAMSLPRERASLLPGGDHDGGCEVVQLHGDLKVLRCDICRQTCRWEDDGREALLLRGRAPECDSCQSQNQDRQNRGKRATKVGFLRPNIVLYGEEHPSSDAIGTISSHDIALAPDVLLILGTSLHVHGLKILVKEFARSVHSRPGGKGKVVFVNLTRPSESIWKDVIDYWVSMDCDEWIAALRRHRPDLWQIQDQLELQIKKPTSKLPRRTSLPLKISEKTGNEKENAKPLKSASQLKSRRVVIEEKARSPLQNILIESSKALIKTVPAANPSSRPMPCVQFPTPPSSGHRVRLQDISRKRSQSYEMEVPETPSKRRKPTLEIWQDKDVILKEENKKLRYKSQSEK